MSREVGIKTEADSHKRQADTLVYDWEGGACCAQDWAVAHIMTQADLKARVADPNRAVIEAERSKEKREGGKCEKVVGIKYLPLAVDTFGGFGPNAIAAMERVANEMRVAKDMDPTISTKRLAQKLRVVVMSHVANELLRRSKLYGNETEMQKELETLTRELECKIQSEADEVAEEEQEEELAEEPLRTEDEAQDDSIRKEKPVASAAGIQHVKEQNQSEAVQSRDKQSKEKEKEKEKDAWREREREENIEEQDATKKEGQRQRQAAERSKMDQQEAEEGNQKADDKQRRKEECGQTKVERRPGLAEGKNPETRVVNATVRTKDDLAEKPDPIIQRKAGKWEEWRKQYRREDRLADMKRTLFRLAKEEGLEVVDVGQGRGGECQY